MRGLIVGLSHHAFDTVIDFAKCFGIVATPFGDELFNRLSVEQLLINITIHSE